MKYTIEYTREAFYSDETKDMIAHEETIEFDGDITDFLKSIYNNQKFLRYREEDVIDFQKAENLTETKFEIDTIVYKKDEEYTTLYDDEIVNMVDKLIDDGDITF